MYCPFCGQNDRIEKVSAIVAKGTSEFEGRTQQWVQERVRGKDVGHWEEVPLRVTQVSELASKLSAPVRPDYSPSCWWLIAPFIPSPWIWAWFAPISQRMKVALGIMLVLVVFIYSLSPLFPTNTDDSGAMIAGLSMYFCLIPILLIASLVAYYVGLREETTSRRAHIESAELPRWQMAKDRWDRLYYCFRDDLVFDPETGETCRTETLQQFLYANTRTSSSEARSGYR